MTGWGNAAPAIAMAAAFVLAWFGLRLGLRPDTRTKGVRMALMAAVLVANVVIWTM